MALQNVNAKYAAKDEKGNSVLVDGEAVILEASVNYDFGDNLQAAIENCGEEAVFSNFVANAKVGLQSIIRSKLKQGLTPDQIQAIADSWKPGMVADKVQIDPAQAIKAAFNTWSPEKKAEFLAGLGIGV
jgi:hypothetical protein